MVKVHVKCNKNETRKQNSGSPSCSPTVDSSNGRGSILRIFAVDECCHSPPLIAVSPTHPPHGSVPLTTFTVPQPSGMQFNPA